MKPHKHYYKETRWSVVVTWFQLHHAVKSVVQRGNYLKLAGRFFKLNESRLDEYRCILERAGYIKTIDKGVYKVIKKIPEGLTYTKARTKAYGKREHVPTGVEELWCK